MNEQFMHAFYWTLNGWPGDAAALDAFGAYCAGGEI